MESVSPIEGTAPGERRTSISLSEDLVVCPVCHDGAIYERCPECNGNASIDEEECYQCRGAGEIASDVCMLCEGTGNVSYDLLYLYEADRWVRLNEPGWDGTTRSGITLFSKAAWFRKRELRNLIWKATGEVAGRDEHIVRLFFAIPSSDVPTVLTFDGFSWGYAGEGPNGLASVLVDCGFFNNHEEAITYVARKRSGEGWRLIGNLPPFGIPRDEGEAL
jgi:hypothetical protein